MSLTADVSKIPNWKTLCINPDPPPDDHYGGYKPVTYALIMYCGLITGIREITKKNWQEVWSRIQLSESTGNAMLRRHELTEEDVKAHIGLSTNGNVFSRAKFELILGKTCIDACKRHHAAEKAGIARLAPKEKTP